MTLNFFRAARHGLEAQFNWIDKQPVSASSLILEHLIPLARKGLSNAQVELRDIDKYLGIIESRARSGQTGSRWILKTLSAMPQTTPKEVRSRRLTAAILACQKQGQPVHDWSAPAATECDDWEQGYRTVRQFMSTDLFTVRPDDLIDLAASVMDWRHIRHVPVEDSEGRLVGLITHRSLLRLMTNGTREQEDHPTTIREIMVPNPVAVTPSTTSLEAIAVMREHKIGCLPVVEDGQLVGIVTSYDFLAASARLFEQHLTASNAG